MAITKTVEAGKTPLLVVKAILEAPCSPCHLALSALTPSQVAPSLRAEGCWNVAAIRELRTDKMRFIGNFTFEERATSTVHPRVKPVVVVLIQTNPIMASGMSREERNEELGTIIFTNKPNTLRDVRGVVPLFITYLIRSFTSSSLFTVMTGLNGDKRKGSCKESLDANSGILDYNKNFKVHVSDTHREEPGERKWGNLPKGSWGSEIMN
ncbi:hypothetical protein Syun_025882 [Stephania yunnanensis]|uniref:Uncharacterized protein n=1 Tax=Stephania yunnanensis TaxID=152371 RepID=A0AAP0EXV5_9MAGN